MMLVADKASLRNYKIKQCSIMYIYNAMKVDWQAAFGEFCD